MDTQPGGAECPKVEACDSVLLVRSSDFRWEAIAFVIVRSRTLSIVGDTTSAEKALRIASQRAPNIVLLGADVSGIDVVALTDQLRTAAPRSKIVVFGNELDHEVLFALGQVPADAYLLYAELSPAIIASALQSVRLGLRVSSAAVADELLAPPGKQRHPRLDSLRLTDRERAVLHWLGEGLTESRIAEIEGVRERTIQRSVASLLDKFGTASVLELRMLAHDRRY